MLRVEHDGGLVVLTIDSQPLNLFTHELQEAFRRAVADLAAAPPRAVLVRAEGRVVSAGVDVSVFAPLDEAGARALWEENLVMIQQLEALPCPTVFAAHALCLTAAFEIALACDLLLASRSASFGLVEARVGLTPSMGGTQRLADRAGPARAREMVMTGDVYNAEAMARWNVVNRVIDDEGFDGAVLALVRSLAEGPTKAHAATKEIVAAQVRGGVSSADAQMAEISARLFETEDLKGAVAAFLEHRGPGHASFEGR